MIKVFSKLFVGISGRLNSAGIPLGFMTPYEDNYAGRKRQESVHNWLGGPVEKRVTKIIDNTPREGFTITDDVRRYGYWGAGRSLFRIKDPDGFELEIDAGNLSALILFCDIHKGVIQGKCIWGRDGAVNVLLHETSEEYKSAIHNAESFKPLSVDKNEFSVGSKILTTGGIAGIYLGRYWFGEVESGKVDYTAFSNVSLQWSQHGYFTPVPVSASAAKVLSFKKQFHIIQTKISNITSYELVVGLNVKEVLSPPEREFTMEDVLGLVNDPFSRISHNLSQKYNSRFVCLPDKKASPVFNLKEVDFDTVRGFVTGWTLRDYKSYTSMAHSLGRERTVFPETELIGRCYGRSTPKTLVAKINNAFYRVDLSSFETFIRVRNTLTNGSISHHNLRRNEIVAGHIDTIVAYLKQNGCSEYPLMPINVSDSFVNSLEVDVSSVDHVNTGGALPTLSAFERKLSQRSRQIYGSEERIDFLKEILMLTERWVCDNPKPETVVMKLDFETATTNGKQFTAIKFTHDAVIEALAALNVQWYQLEVTVK